MYFAPVRKPNGRTMNETRRISDVMRVAHSRDDAKH